MNLIPNNPRYVVILHNPTDEQVLVCTEFPTVISGHLIVGQVMHEVRNKGSWTHPSGDFTIRIEGISPYPERYVFALRHPGGKVEVQIVHGWPAAVAGTPIPPALKVVVDTKGWANSDDKNFIICKEGTWNDT